MEQLTAAADAVRQAAPALEVNAVHHAYGEVEVLHGVSLLVEAGDRHAIVGENGAGKSTLMRVICGLLRPSGGSVRVDGTTLAEGIEAARAAGIWLVHQELSLIPTMSIAENVVVGSHPTRRGIVDRAAVRQAGLEVIAAVGLQHPPERLVGDLAFAERQLVEIGRALRARPRVLVLDEPTSALSPAESARLFRTLLGLQGTTVLYVSHRISEVYALCQRATVLRDGHLVGTFDLGDTPPRTLIASMVGREIDLLQRREPIAADRLGPPRIEAEHLSGPRVDDISFTVRSGEVLGIGGLVGAGRSDLLALLAGTAHRSGGTVRIDGQPVGLRNSFDAWRGGVALVPEDRHLQGLALTLSTADNVVAPTVRSLSRFGWLRRRAIGRRTREVVDASNIVPPEPRRIAGSLSGGNQQKVVLGKWLPFEPRVLLLDEPTKGVDVASRDEIHRRVDRLAHAGVAVVVVSSDMAELLTLADRILVMRDGRSVGFVERNAWTEQHVIELATHGEGAAFVTSAAGR